MVIKMTKIKREEQKAEGKGNMIKILFVCHGNILKFPGNACKINDFAARKGAYYTTTTPFLKEP